MEATASASDFPRESRTKKFGAKIKRTAKRAVTKTRNGVKATGSFLMSTVKKIGRGTASAARYVGVSAQRAVGFIGIGLGLVIKTALSVLSWALLIVSVLVLGVVSGLVFLVIGLIVGLNLVYDSYIHGTFSWLARKERRATLGEYRFAREYAKEYESHKVWNRVRNWAAKAFDIPAEQYDDVERYEDDIVVPDQAQKEEESPFNREMREAREKYVKDLPMADTFPGAEIYDGVSMDGTQMEEENGWAKPGFPIIKSVAADNLLEHDFSVYEDLDQLLQVFEFYGDDNDLDMETRSVFKGRHAMLKCYMDHKDTGKWNDLYGRYWALLFNKFVHRQDEYSMKFIKAGFYREYEEIKLKVSV